MRKSIIISSIAVSLSVVSCLLLVNSCASLKVFLNSASTSLQSTSLQAASVLRAQGVKINGVVSGGNYYLTPTKISGKVLSVVLPVDSQEDEGIVPFGDGRPDIAPANSTLYDFDLSAITTLRKDAIGVKPGFVGGSCGQIILLFGYFDVEFLQDTTARKIRMVYGDTSTYVRGDKLLGSGEANSEFYWYNTSSEAFVRDTGTRPAYPSLNTYVRDFSDPDRQEMHYYLLGAILRNNRDYDGTTRNTITLSKKVVTDNNLAFTVDFDVQNAVVFPGVTSEPAFLALSNADLLKKFDMKQNVSSWGNSGLYCSITFEATPKYSQQ